MSNKKCDEYTKKQLVSLASSDWGLTKEHADKFKEEVLRDACKASQGASNYIKLILEMIEKEKIEPSEIFE
jgi:hypothetical protein